LAGRPINFLTIDSLAKALNTWKATIAASPGKYGADHNDIHLAWQLDSPTSHPLWLFANNLRSSNKV
jgi:hypothetical protein